MHLSKSISLDAETAGARSVDQAVRQLARGVAWPLVGLFVLLLTILIASSWLAIAGAIPLWLGSVVNFPAFYTLSHINHEATHRNISGVQGQLKWLNELVGQIGSFPFFLPYRAFRINHMAHHRLTNHHGDDPDMWFAGKSFFAVLLRGSLLLPAYEVSLIKLIRKGYATRLDLLIIYGERLAAVALVVGLFSAGYGAAAFWLWIAPCLTVMIALGFLAYAVHYPHESTENLLASNIWLGDKRLQPLITAVFMFQNYHLIHHEYPRLPFYKCGKAFRMGEERLASLNAAIRRL